LVVVVGSEPLTKSRRSEIEEAGASIYPRYAATEMGTIAMGCGNPEEVDEHHLMSDMVGMVQKKGTPAGKEGPLYLTSLNQVMPKIMLNVQLGDIAAVSKRNCGCPFEEIGFTTHISRIRSYSRFTGDGMAVSRCRMEQLIEGLLTARYGGSSIDYQLVEIENRDGQTELKLRISPEVGEIDEESLARDVLIALRNSGEGEQLMAAVWQETGMFSVVREFPQPTSRGKLGPLLQEHQS
jgi:phenylacetate-coenzyme A ligase PaaK-like adenylate-forming protein